MERRPGLPIGTRGILLLGLLAAGIWALAYLDLSPAGLAPGEGGVGIAKRFFAGALAPALDYEGSFVPPDAPPFLLQALRAVGTTIVVAAAAIALSVALGVVLAFLASTSWWAGDPAGARSPVLSLLRRTVAPLLYFVVRVVIGIMRSIHELLWAVLFLAAVGFSPLTAIIAIAIPYAGTLAKVFSEMIDEAPRDTADALRGAGASPLQVFFFGLVPRALPDLIAYAFYRFECAIRSAAVMGFFGIATLGAYVKQSFDSTNYGEVWTYLYLTFFVVLVMDLWSGQIRRRLVA